MKLTIDRTKWLRGESGMDSYLLHPQRGLMCCLGFYCVAKGIPESEFLQVGSPASVCRISEGVFFNNLEDLVDFETHDGDDHQKYENNRICNKLMLANDHDWVMDSKEREEELTNLFKKIDVDVEFVD